MQYHWFQVLETVVYSVSLVLSLICKFDFISLISMYLGCPTTVGRKVPAAIAARDIAHEYASGSVCLLKEETHPLDRCCSQLADDDNCLRMYHSLRRRVLQ